MYTLLTFTSLHIRFLKADYAPPSLKELRRFQHAISGYRNSLAESEQHRNADSLLATSTIMGGIALALVAPCEPHAAWPLAESPDDELWWLRMLGGIGLVRSQTIDHLTPGPFRTLWHDNGPEGRPIQLTTSASHDSFIATLEDIYTSPTAVDSGVNPYLKPLKVLDNVLQMSSTSELLIDHMQFLTQLDPTFISLLQAKDHLALLLLCLWYGKVATLSCWWSQIRSRQEHRSIAIYLESHADSRIKDILKQGFQGLCASSRAEQARRCLSVPDVKEFCHTM